MAVMAAVPPKFCAARVGETGNHCRINGLFVSRDCRVKSAYETAGGYFGLESSVWRCAHVDGVCESDVRGVCRNATIMLGIIQCGSLWGW